MAQTRGVHVGPAVSTDQWHRPTQLASQSERSGSSRGQCVGGGDEDVCENSLVDLKGFE